MKNKILIFIFFLFTSCVKEKPNSNASSKNTSSSEIESETTIPNTQVPNYNKPNESENTPNIDYELGPDPLKYESWHLKNIGQASYSLNSGKQGIDLNLEEVQERGIGILIAVSDTGIESSHEDLIHNFDLENSKNYSLSTSGFYGNPTPDNNSHGTSVAGIISATENNKKGSSGIASKAMIAGLKFVGLPISLTQYIDQANGIYDIFNYSYGGYSCEFVAPNSTYIDQLRYGVTQLRNGHGAIYVKAGGNEYYSNLKDCYNDLDSDDHYYLGNTNLEGDHSYPYYILTTAINSIGFSSSYSTPGSSLWISAPGGEDGKNSPAIITTDLTGCISGASTINSDQNSFQSGEDPNTNCNYTSTMNGSSSSTPMISAVAALILEAKPTLTWRDVKYILAKSAKKIDTARTKINHPKSQDLDGHIYQQSWVTNASGFHFHNWYGFGLADAKEAVALAKSYNQTLGFFKNEIVTSQNNLNLTVPDESSVGISHNLNFQDNFNIEAVQISVNIEHNYIGDLGIELTSPSGTKSILMNINSGLIQKNISNEILLSNAFFMEKSKGLWTIKIIDGSKQDIGKLMNWSLRIYGH